MQVRQRFWVFLVFSAIIIALFLAGMTGVYFINHSTQEKFDRINSVYVPLNKTMADMRHELREMERKFSEIVYTNDPSVMEEVTPHAKNIEIYLRIVSENLPDQAIVRELPKFFNDYYVLTTQLAAFMRDRKLEDLTAEISRVVFTRSHFEEHVKELEDFLRDNYQAAAVATQSQMRQLTTIVFTMIIVLTTVLILGSFVIMRNVSNRLNTLVTFAKQVESGIYEENTSTAWNDEFAVVMHAFNSMVKSVKDATDQLNRLANYDALTEVHNRNSLIQRLNTELRAVRRHKYPLTFCMCDIDKFKTVNDQFGHLTGDKILKTYANCVRDALRTEDIIGRYGGDEFGIIFPHTKAVDAAIALNRLRERFSERVFVADNGEEFSVTTSFGLCEFTEEMDADTLISLADEALYHSKKQGRNQVSIHSA